MHEGERACVEALRADPYDDTRLSVYADWLLEHDAARGEYLTHSLTIDGSTDSQLEQRAVAAWERVLGPELTVHDFFRGLPSGVFFHGDRDALVPRLPRLAAQLPRPTALSLYTRGGLGGETLVVRNDWRVAAAIATRRTTSGLAYYWWFRVQLLQLPSLALVAEAAEELCWDNEPDALGVPRSAPLHVRFVEDELRWFSEGDAGARRSMLRVPRDD